MAGAEAPGFYVETVVLLSGAVIAAPLFKRIGLGTVLGYLAAGVIIGPVGRVITGAEEILHVAELGVVFLLFLIGLELKPARLWTLRRDIFGLGLAQVVITGLVLSALARYLAGFGFNAAVTIGFGLALSSTAFALQVLEERGEINRRHGRKSFAILLFQDMAIVPLLALLPFLAPFVADDGSNALNDFLIAIAAVAALVFAGRFLLNPLFQVIGNTGAREAMIAAALLVVIGSALLMSYAGLSMAMGAFLAGVMLAESSYRHELEADIEPFRGLLLGLFFMAIGISLEISVIMENWVAILLAVPVLMFTKAAIIYALCRSFGIEHDVAMRTALVLPQGGEFGFVLFSTALTMNILDAATASQLVCIVTLSMALTPVSVLVGNLLVREEDAEEMEEDFEDAGADVLMVGFSRFGQIASQVLLAGGYDITMIDHSADRVRSAQKFGFRVYFGDGTRKDVLEAAGIKRAKIVAVCTQKKEITDKIVDLVQSEYPNAKLFVRSYDRAHTLELRARGVDYEMRETFKSGLEFGKKTLEALGNPESLAQSILEDVEKRDTERLCIQQAEGIYAGGHMLHTRPVTPEPLTKPRRESKVIDTTANGDGNVLEEDET
ncbi:monovalent cation:proton antiporter-2 (CPA2) family protein [Oricola thermophila]|uniref:Cation:proton antiporter n=1 Tax=Oricola thermophila TaxID=2742145 RepID=A0A6N1VET7_9HYPH|nr:monovalent cation:proton antiporter-2 (CPA2) family protein [Oricola thermophila]QKV19208.1 cation:proton antiporter [Oricola thermophila]